jgi:sortase A
MSVWPPVEECCSGPGWLWRLSRSLFLLTAIVALGYSGWIYLDEYWHERRESKAFNNAREKAREAPTSGTPSQTQWFAAKLSIPRLRLSTIVEEGVEENTLRRAAGHIRSTGLPGQPGNIGIAAHRDTLFRRLSGIREHDRIVLSTLRRDYNYEVISTSIVNPDDVSVLAPLRGQQTLTLVTCYPFYFIGRAPRRFIVHARQIDENVQGKGMSLAVQNAREHVTTAEEAHVIAERRQQKEKLAKVQADGSAARQAGAQVDAARVQADDEGATLQRTESRSDATPQRVLQAGAQAAEKNWMRAADPFAQHQQEQTAEQKTELRLRLLAQLNGVVAIRDTPRGLVATVGDVDFRGPVLREMAVSQVARIGAIVSAYPELRIEVEGHTDSTGTEALSGRRAEAVRGVLVGNGLLSDKVAARGFGDRRLLVSNADATGRQKNRRVEIVISGDPIGNLALWDRSYSLMHR